MHDGLIGDLRTWHARDPECRTSGLGWYLAANLVNRFHISHGHRVEVYWHDGLGFSGLLVMGPACEALAPIGRFRYRGGLIRYEGDVPVEGPELDVVRDVVAGADPMSAIPAAIAHLGLAPYPSPRHRICRHRHRGGSYVLMFNIAARLALRHPDLVFTSGTSLRHTELTDPDPPPEDDREHPGYITVSSGESVALRGDGRLIGGRRETTPSLWELHMAGHAVGALVRVVEQRLGVPSR